MKNNAGERLKVWRQSQRVQLKVRVKIGVNTRYITTKFTRAASKKKCKNVERSVQICITQTKNLLFIDSKTNLHTTVGNISKCDTTAVEG